MSSTLKLKKIILASQSPRRAEILKNAGYKFVSFPVSISEIPNKNLSLDDQIIDIARRKGQASYDKLFTNQQKNPDLDLNNDIIVASDTMVCFQNEAIGKPDNVQNAFDILKKLSGQTHQVKTALYVFDLETKSAVSHIETSTVTFRHFSDHEITEYIQTGEPMDKAGAYAIQGIGSKLVDHFEGDYQNIVGLPLNCLQKIFTEHRWILDQIKVDDSYYMQLKMQLTSQQHLLAVSKLQPTPKIEALYRLGQKHFGENYIQEALKKIELLKPLDIQWHLIGPIQKNKVKYLKNNFAYIHSVDSYELAYLISEKALQINYQQKIFLQINLSQETSKSGFNLSSIKSEWDSLIKLKGIKIIGLMTMPPLQNNAEENRPFFKELFELSRQLGLSELSMGTSHDYKVALEEGATWIRLGTVLFGEREKIK